MSEIILIAHNLRSTHNVGSLLRTAEGLGVERVYLTGYTPYPSQANDTRLPHLTAKLTRQIQKAALGAENSQAWEYRSDVNDLINELHQQNFVVAALEQTPSSQSLPDYKQAPGKLAVIVGREVEGLEPEVLALCDLALEIPMKGKKESFNVTQATAMALYQLTWLAR